MISHTNFTCWGKDGCFPCGGRTTTRRSRTVAAAGQWTLGGIVDAIRRIHKKQENGHAPASQRPAGKEQVQPSMALPPTFQRLSPELVVLLDPKNDRLLYLFSVDEASTSDRVVGQLRDLLHAASAPYVHLMTLPARLRSDLLREFPGGRPIISQVPLPVELAADNHHNHNHIRPAVDSQLGDSAPEGARRWPRGGVLDLLYGTQQQQQQLGRDGGAAALPDSGGPSVAQAKGAGQALEQGAEQDVPDEVMSRRKKMRGLMAWLKGTSMREALRRDSYTPYKFESLISDLNSFGVFTAFLAAPDLMFVRNGIAASLASDHSPGMYDDDDDDDDEKDEEEDEVMRLGPGDDLAAVLKAIGMVDDGDEGEEEEEGGDEGEEEEEGGDEGEEEGGEEGGDPPDVTVLGALPPPRGLERSGGPSPEPPSAATLRQLAAEDDLGDYDTPFNVDVPLSEGPMGWTAALRVRPDPHRGGGRGGGRDVGAAGASHGGGSWGAAPEAGDRDEAAESLLGSRGSEHFANVQRLEALWERQGRAESQRQGQKLGEWQQSSSVSPPPPVSSPPPSPPPAASSPASSPSRLGQDGASISLGRAQAGSASGGVQAGLLGGPGSAPPTEEGRGRNDLDGSAEEIEAAWREAERAAAAATTTGRARLAPGGGDGVWGVPTDCLLRPVRRPGASPDAEEPEQRQQQQGQAEGHTGSRQHSVSPAAASPPELADVGDVSNSVSNNVSADPSASASALPSPPLSSVAATAAGDFVPSTRPCRAAAAGTYHSAGGAGASTSGRGTEAAGPEPSDGEGSGQEGTGGAPEPTRPTGRSRMVRRPRRPLRPAGQLPDAVGRSPEAGTDDTCGSSPSASASATSSSVEGGAGSAAATGPASVGSGEGVVSIPAYRHLRQPTGSAGAAAASKGARGHMCPASPGAQHPPTGAGGSASGGGPHGAAVRPDGGGGGASAQPLLPPEAAGYAALDLEQLAHFVLGRQASPEEVQDLARAVAQSAEVEEAFSSAVGGLQPLGGGGEYPWRRPGTPPPTLREQLLVSAGSRRSVVTRRRRRLRIPERVLEMLGRGPQGEAKDEGEAGRSTGTLGTDGRSSGQGDARSAGGDDGSLAAQIRRVGLSAGLTLRRPGLQKAVEEVAAAAAAPPPPAREPSQEELAEEVVRALRAAPPLEQQRAEALVAFLRGRRQPQRQRQAAAAAGERGLPGLARGRDAVVVLPRGLLEVVAGAWQQEEERLMHADVLGGRAGRS